MMPTDSGNNPAPLFTAYCPWCLRLFDTGGKCPNGCFDAEDVRVVPDSIVDAITKERDELKDRIKELEEDVYRIGCDRQKAEARILELEEQAERCECDKHDWEKAEGRIKELEDITLGMRCINADLADHNAALEHRTVLAEARIRELESRLEAVVAVAKALSDFSWAHVEPDCHASGKRLNDLLRNLRDVLDAEEKP